MNSIVKVVKLIYIILNFISYGLSIQNYENYYCYSYDKNESQYQHFATKTSYHIEKGKLTADDIYVPNCKPEKLWLLVRHGTRLPKLKFIKQSNSFNQLREKISSNFENKTRTTPDLLCDEDLKLIQNWRWNDTITTDLFSTLTDKGWQDVKKLAQDYKKVLPEILSADYSAQKYFFMPSNTQRTKASYLAFVEGLFNNQTISQQSVEYQSDRERDLILRSFNSCNLTENSLDYEYLKFQNSSIYQQMIKDVSLRLGFGPNKLLSQDDIGNIWNLCRYDFAWNTKQKSPWCTAFTKSQINILEYSIDLIYYYRYGYGVRNTENLFCHGIQDMVKLFEDKNEDFLQLKAYFGHSSSVLLLLRALGAVQDTEHLRADNYEEMSQRKYRTSVISPFTANIAVIKYKCQSLTMSGTNETITVESKIRFFLNEKPLYLDWCNDTDGFCKWSDMERNFKKFRMENCDLLYCSEEIDESINSGAFTFRIFGLFSIVFIACLVAAMQNCFTNNSQRDNNYWSSLSLGRKLRFYLYTFQQRRRRPHGGYLPVFNCVFC